MLIRPERPWSLSENDITPESVWLNRREVLAGMGLGGGLIAGGMMPGVAAAAPITGFPAPRNPDFVLDREITDEELATTYTNFYEFGSSKNIHKRAKKLKTDPWKVVIKGMIEDEYIRIDAADLISQLGGMEERLYRHRCVEAWAMAVPWTGIPLEKLVNFVRPKAGAKYVRFETFHNPDIAPGQRQKWQPWPYTEGLTIEEASNPLTFLATGIYGKPMPKQNGAPIRLVIPWKYGFKSIKSISKITFTDKQPVSYWEKLQKNEYGFWANVNPEFSHPRWSQASERLLGVDGKVPTQKYNGYGEWVEHLYAHLPQDRALFF